MIVSMPNETAKYRAARNALLDAEMELRVTVERVAAMRRALPSGGHVPEDYEFEGSGGKPVRLSALFEDGKSSLLLYSYMYGPNAKAPCPACTSLLDGLNAQAPHIVQQANLAVVISGPIENAEKIAAERGWRNLLLLSVAGNAYNRQYHGESSDGDQMPMMNVFVKTSDGIRHHWGSEMLFAAPEAGQDPRHMDMMWPLWNALDLTPAGRGDWRPDLAYD